MKIKILFFVLFLALGAWFLAPCSYAKPERIQIKETNKRAKEVLARAQIKNIDLTKIEDPEARRAIGEILNYLDLKAKN